MDKKASPNKENDSKPKGAGVSSKISGLSNKAFAIIKFILGICFLPFVYSGSVAFLNEFSLIGKSYQNYFWSGVITLLLIYLFVWEPVIIYAKGQKLLELIFTFFKPLVKVAPYLLPIYTVVLFIAYELLSLAVKEPWVLEYSIFLLGLTISLHIIFSAKSLRLKSDDFLKANYIFGFSFIYILNLVLLSFCINLVFKEFSFVNFANTTFSQATNIFYAVLKQLFFPAR